MSLFSKILIANRGEIAVRIMRTARKMGIATVAVYTADESETMHARMADEARELPGNSLAETYLNAGQIISIAKKTGADAIHPGYGFLSENENFAAACEEAGITFIGPRPETISLMGNKTRARESARNAGIPVIEGYTGPTDQLLEKANDLKYPLLVKAVSGGGGMGMQIVNSSDNLQKAMETSAREAFAWFGNSSVYLEQFLENSRHIEVQLLGDNWGNTVHLYERECSVQRRYQKIIEEAPSPFVSGRLRGEITEAALRLARAINYRSAGTVEFLVDRAGKFYFLEMNTRIQVEHPVTEAVTGVDIIKEQILIAAGQKLRYSQDHIKCRGHAIECRIYAEDPSAGFIPSPGRMTCYHEPDGTGIRVDSGYEAEAEISGNYDPLISKLITFGGDREEARMKMAYALSNYGLHGIKTNISFLLSLLHNDDFISSGFSTTYVRQNVCKILKEEVSLKRQDAWQIPAIAALLTSLQRKEGKNRVWDSLGYWRTGKTLKYSFEGELNETGIRVIKGDHYRVTLNNEEFTGKFTFMDKRILLEHNGKYHNIFISESREGHYLITYNGFDYDFHRPDFMNKKEISFTAPEISSSGSVALRSPLPGRIIKINKSTGESVKRGEILIIVESMKMENSIIAPADGIVEIVKVKVGEFTDNTSPLLVINHKDTL